MVVNMRILYLFSHCVSFFMHCWLLISL